MACKGLPKFQESGKFSDFTIKCGPYIFAVHKVIISAKSAYFEAACSSDAFKEGAAAMIELASDQNDPSCDDPEAVKSMITYFYGADYEVEKLDFPLSATSPAWKDDGNALAHAKVFAVAVKYDVQGLRPIAVRKFRRAMKVYPEHRSVTDAIKAVFTTTSEDARELRDVVMDSLVANETLLGREDVEATVGSIQGLTLDLVRRLQNDLEIEKKKGLGVECGRCGTEDRSVFKCKSCGSTGNLLAYSIEE